MARRTRMFDPKNFSGAGEERPLGTAPLEQDWGNEASPEEAEEELANSLDIYKRVPQYEKQAQIFLVDEHAFEEYVQESAMVLMQMERDQAMLMPTTKSEITAAIRARQNFVQRAMEMLTLLLKNREKRVQELELRAEILARGGEIEEPGSSA